MVQYGIMGIIKKCSAERNTTIALAYPEVSVKNREKDGGALLELWSHFTDFFL